MAGFFCQVRLGGYLRYFLPIFFLLIIGCGSGTTFVDQDQVTPDPKEVTVDHYNFPYYVLCVAPCNPVVQQSINEANKFWKDGSGELLFVWVKTEDSVGDEEIKIFRGPSPEIEPGKIGNANQVWSEEINGERELIGCDINIVSTYGTYVLVAHELGHCLGLRHVNDPISIMNAEFNSEDQIVTDEILDYLDTII